MTPTANNPVNARPFDLTICCRIYPGLSGRPILGFRDKQVLVRLNLETLREAIGNLKVKLWVLLDKCPPAYAEMVREIFPDTALELMPLPGEGNGATFDRQIDILSRQTDADLVYFAEDDYLYLPGALEQAVRFMQTHPEADAVSLADHSDYHRRYVDRIRLDNIMVENHEWRRVVSTALSFMMRQPALAQAGGVFKTFGKGNSDLGLWMALTKLRVFNPWCLIRGFEDGKFIPGSQVLAWWHAWRYILFGKQIKLWAPIPTLATHLEQRSAAEGVNWEKLFGERLRAVRDRQPT
jgi:hypothetical protein